MLYYFFTLNGRTYIYSASDFAARSEHVTVQS